MTDELTVGPRFYNQDAGWVSVCEVPGVDPDTRHRERSTGDVMGVGLDDSAALTESAARAGTKLPL